MLGLFRSKKQVEDTKALEKLLPKASIVQTSNLKLARLQITYSITQTSQFSASIDYYERPENYSDQGMTKQVRLKAADWAELIDKVLDHFNNPNK